MDRYIDVPEYTALGDGDLGVQLLAIFRAFPWRLDAALVRERWGPPRWHEDRPSQLWDDTDDLVGLWDYLLDRGGNGITWDLDAWTVRTTDAVGLLLTARTAEIVAATHGPLGEAIPIHLPDDETEPVTQDRPPPE